MKQLTTLISALFFLILSVSHASALPNCTGSWSASNWKNCFGTYTYTNGDKYVGEFKNGKRHGQGTLTYPDGDKYVGEYKDNKRHGQGTYTYGPNSEWAGDKYVGEWKDNIPHGQGTLTLANGGKSVGAWENGKLNGYAIIYYADGSIWQEGIFKDGKFLYALSDLNSLKKTNECVDCVLSGADLKGVNLKGANLKGAKLNEANLSDANLTGANLTEANLKEANFIGAHLREVDLFEANLEGANLEGANLEGANLEGANLTEANLNGANLTEANLKEANLTLANLTEVNLKEANLNGADLTQTNRKNIKNIPGSLLKELREIDLKRLISKKRCKNCDLVGVNLEGVDLSRGNLSDSNLKGANLKGANLKGARFIGANLNNANISDTNLTSANFTEANLEGAILSGAILRGANFKGANLEGANLEGAKFERAKLTKANLKNIILEDSRQQFNLGNMYETGNGIDKNEEMAFKWYTLSAEQGNEQAQVNLAEMYAEGRGIPQNNIEAIRLYTLAAKQGNQIAKDALPNVLLIDFIYGHDVQKMDNLREKILTICSTNFRCAFDEVWQYLDITKDGNISLAELSKFQRNLVKYVYVNQAWNEVVEKVKVEDIAAINAISILLLPITSSSILNSFDYNNDGTLQKKEVFGDSEFAKLIGIDTKSLITGMDFQDLGNRLNSVLDGFPFSLMK